MKQKSIEEYVKDDMIAPTNYKNQILLSGIIVFLGLWAGVISQRFFILVCMFLLFIISFIIVLKSKTSGISLRKKLIIQTIIHFNWLLQFELLASLFFVHEFGINFGIFLLYLPAAICSIILCITKSINFKRKKTNQFKFPWAIFSTIPIALGIFGGLRTGKALNEALKTLSTRSYTIVMILILVILSCFFSIGALNIQKMYYLKKYNIGE